MKLAREETKIKVTGRVFIVKITSNLRVGTETVGTKKISDQEPEPEPRLYGTVPLPCPAGLAAPRDRVRMRVCQRIQIKIGTASE
jgi:hypothetical protein